MIAVLALAWPTLVLVAAWSGRPATRDGAPRQRRPHVDLDAARTRAVAALATVAGVTPILPLLAPLAGAAVWLLLARGPSRRARRRAAEVAASLPEAVDLLALAVTAGCTVPQAVAVVAARGHGAVARSLRGVVAATGRGARCADALEALPTALGDAVRPLVAPLVACERYGAPVADALDRVASEVRAGQRRRAEEAARRIPVKLLFPLVLCILPAFALLTVVPLLAGGLASL